MSKDFKKHGLGHYIGKYVLGSCCAVRNIKHFILENHPELLEKRMYSRHEVTLADTLDTIIRAITEMKDTALELEQFYTTEDWLKDELEENSNQ